MTETIHDPETVPDTGAGDQDAGGPLFLARLSDEELVLLDAEHPLVALPHHERLEPAQRQVAVSSALRALGARGHEIDTDAHTIALPQHLCDLLDLRSGATAVLLWQVMVVDGASGSEQACQHYAFVEDDVVLLEDVTADGLHDFWVLGTDELIDQIQARVPRVDGARDGAGGPLRVDLMAVAAGESQATVDCLGVPLARIDATVWRAPATPDPPLQAVVLGECGTYVSVAPAEAEGPITLTPITVSSVGREVARLLGPDTMLR